MSRRIGWSNQNVQMGRQNRTGVRGVLRGLVRKVKRGNKVDDGGELRSRSRRGWGKNKVVGELLQGSQC